MSFHHAAVGVISGSMGYVLTDLQLERKNLPHQLEEPWGRTVVAQPGSHVHSWFCGGVSVTRGRGGSSACPGKQSRGGQEVGEQNSKGSEKPVEEFQEGQCSLTGHKNNLGSLFKNIDHGTYLIRILSCGTQGSG